MWENCVKNEGKMWENCVKMRVKWVPNLTCHVRKPHMRC